MLDSRRSEGRSIGTDTDQTDIDQEGIRMDQGQGAKIRSIVAEQLGVDLSEVTPDASIVESWK